MATNVNIDFQVLETGDPNILIICDTSTWGIIEDKTAIIEFRLPSEKLVVHEHIKKQNSIFNSSNLYISAVGVLNPLPDGLYKITVKGSPDSYCKERYYLRTEKLQLKLDKLIIGEGVGNICNDQKLNDFIFTTQNITTAAKAAVRQGKSKMALSLYTEAQKRIEEYENCNDC